MPWIGWTLSGSKFQSYRKMECHSSAIFRGSWCLYWRFLTPLLTVTASSQSWGRIKLTSGGSQGRPWPSPDLEGALERIYSPEDVKSLKSAYYRYGLRERKTKPEVKILGYCWRIYNTIHPQKTWGRPSLLLQVSAGLKVSNPPPPIWCK